MKHFLLIGTMRSGTTLLSTKLRSHPEISMPSDEFKLNRVLCDPLSFFNYGGGNVEDNRQAPPKFFRFLSRINSDNSTVASGIKCAIYSLDGWEQCIETLRTQLSDIVIISTIREDMIALIGSTIRASKTGQWHSWSHQNQKAGTINIDPLSYSETRFHFKKIISDIRTFRATHTYFEVSYENDILENSDYMSKIAELLKVDQNHHFVSRSRKVAPHPSQYIKNYAEILELENYLNTTGKRLTHTLGRRIRRKLTSLRKNFE